MSPWLFNIFMDNIVREAKQRFNRGVEMETGTIQLLLYVDNIMLVAERDKDAERNGKVMDEVMKKWRKNILEKDKGNGGEERRHMQHCSKWDGDRKCEDNEIPRSHVGRRGIV